MSPDARYMYQGSPNMPAQYPYSPYSPYDAAQYPPSSSRPARNSANQPPPNAPHQPPPAAYSPQPPPGYPQQPYAPPPPYGAPPPPPNSAQWAPEGWAPYPPPFVPSNPPSVQESQPFARPESQPQTQGEAGPTSAATSGPSNPDNRRTEDRATDPAPPPSRARKGKNSEHPALTPLPPAHVQGLDYDKLVESYRVVLESANAIAMGGSAGRGDGAVENVEQMLRSAIYGRDMLDAAAQRSASEASFAASAAAEHPTEGGDAGAGNSRQVGVSRPDQPAEGGQTCLGCSATSTPEWRRGPLGPRTLCNACGLVYAKLIKKRTREPGRTRGSRQSKHGGGPDVLSSGDDGSDDEDSNGSQDRRSDTGR
ncbi:hypothetical protein PHLGIDRAFT_175837 [Phlebiopsis gigantea 11061_1 CR5-6]|uniref:GATA-type domain-containing protein n=1 Tax=Phlebiopsis gigantea (strain 11061_1 CR5-6) TaxID=745531 RepID=A0A0C3S7Y5_PHLG1|nr:hypothetical protein PHLGIDRAFT_175837 [Phlebiopsis gigantea 11061_1 CR5-6]